MYGQIVVHKDIPTNSFFLVSSLAFEDLNSNRSEKRPLQWSTLWENGMSQVASVRMYFFWCHPMMINRCFQFDWKFSVYLFCLFLASTFYARMTDRIKTSISGSIYEFTPKAEQKIRVQCINCVNARGVSSAAIHYFWYVFQLKTPKYIFYDLFFYRTNRYCLVQCIEMRMNGIWWDLMEYM